MIKTIRYPRYNTPNPTVTCFVVNLNVLKYINLIPLVLPYDLIGDFYIGNMFWISNQELTLTYTSRDQTMSSTVLCKAPQFECFEVSRMRNSVFCHWISRADVRWKLYRISFRLMRRFAFLIVMEIPSLSTSLVNQLEIYEILKSLVNLHIISPLFLPSHSFHAKICSDTTRDKQ